MARCGTCGAAVAAGCQCTFGESDCFRIDQSGGVGSPAIVVAKFDPDPDNLASCSPAGLAAFNPPHINNPPVCRVRSSVDLEIPHNVLWTLTFNVEDGDTDNMHSVVSATSRVTFRTPGWYRVQLQLTWEGSGATRRDIRIRRTLFAGGASTIARTSDTAESTVGQRHDASTLFPFQENDYIEAMVLQTSGSPINIESEESNSPVFFAEFVRPLAA